MPDRSLILRDSEVREFIAKGRVMVRRPITASNSTMYGRPAKWWEFDALDLNRVHTRLEREAGDYFYAPYIGKPSWAPVRSRLSPGDKVWIRETWMEWPDKGFAEKQSCVPAGSSFDHWDGSGVIYRATWGRSISGYQWRSAATMPRWASRLSGVVASVALDRPDGWEWVYGVEKA
ncbi:MAG: hypothetical protein ABFD89_00940 [Bryobacteraceae bacterium]